MIANLWGSGILIFVLVCLLFVCVKEFIEHFTKEGELFGFYTDEFSPFWALVCGILCIWTIVCFVAYLLGDYQTTVEPSLNLLRYYYYG